MGKSICFGNSRMLVGLDKFGQVHDFYYPYVGLENHMMGCYVHKVGIFVDNQFSWLDDGSWQISVDFVTDSMTGEVVAVNQSLQIKIVFTDAVYNEKDVFIRLIQVFNLSDRPRTIKLFLNQQFEIAESHRGDTALFDHDYHVILHYKGERVFLINGKTEEGLSFDDYAVGLLGIEGKEGVYKDAEDGKLSRNNVEHGKVDSVIGFTLQIGSFEQKKLRYWIAVEKTIPKARELNQFVLQRTPEYLIQSTRNFWYAWLNKQQIDFLDLDKKYIDLFKKSLLLIDTHTGGNGVIIASGDSDLLKNGRGTYSYMWPRDGALVILPLIQAGYFHIPENFFLFCKDIITDDGYMLHKYRADEALGSSWHPWVRDLRSELPIQEDETALVVYALWKYYEQTKDLEFIQDVYERLVRRPGEFMLNYINEKNHLPAPTYDLWEEKFGISTFTAATVYGAMLACKNFADLLGKKEEAKNYQTAAENVKTAILKYLWDEELGCFVKLVNITTEGLVADKTVDMSSVHGIIEFGVLEITDPKIAKAIQTVENRIVCRTEIGGVCRYEGDYYFRVSHETPGNPWFITSLWLARYYMKIAKSVEELQPVWQWLDWTLKYAQPSGVLSEQLNPFTGEQLSATPLTWSQAEYVKTILDLLEKIRSIKGLKPAICYI